MEAHFVYDENTVDHLVQGKSGDGKPPINFWLLDGVNGKEENSIV